jgi:hypothetical protein
MFAAIEVDSGDYFLGTSMDEAYEKAERNIRIKSFSSSESAFAQPSS